MAGDIWPGLAGEVENTAHFLHCYLHQNHCWHLHHYTGYHHLKKKYELDYVTQCKKVLVLTIIGRFVALL